MGFLLLVHWRTKPSIKSDHETLENSVFSIITGCPRSGKSQGILFGQECGHPVLQWTTGFLYNSSQINRFSSIATILGILYLFLSKNHWGMKKQWTVLDYEQCSSLSLILLDTAVSVLCISISQLSLTLSICVGGADSLSGRTLRADSRLAPCQWETSLQSNAVSHWLGANLEAALTVPDLWRRPWKFSMEVRKALNTCLNNYTCWYFNIHAVISFK